MNIESTWENIRVYMARMNWSRKDCWRKYRKTSSMSYGPFCALLNEAHIRAELRKLEAWLEAQLEAQVQENRRKPVLDAGRDGEGA